MLFPAYQSELLRKQKSRLRKKKDRLMFEDRVNSFCWELVGRLTCVFVVPWGLPASEVGDLSDEPGNGYDRQTATDREFKC